MEVPKQAALKVVRVQEQRPVEHHVLSSIVSK